MGFTVIGFLIKILKDHKKQILDADIVLLSVFIVMLLYTAIVAAVITLIYLTIAIAVGIISIG